MKTIRADVLDNYVVVYGADDAGEPKTFVIADDSSAYAVLRDAISSASEASPRASVGGAALETEVVEEIPTRQATAPESHAHDAEPGGSWISDAAAFLGDARDIIETDERAGASWGAFMGVLRDLSAQPKGKQ